MFKMISQGSNTGVIVGIESFFHEFCRFTEWILCPEIER